MEETQDPYAESIKAIKSFKLYDHMKVGSFVDVYDNNNSWRVAKIVSREGDVLNFVFDGWSHKWNEAHKITSSKIVPFRTNTVNYTGGLKNPCRELDFPEIFEIKKSLIDEMNSLIETNFLKGDAYSFTQFVRGHLYITVDFILSSLKGPSITEMPVMIEIVEKFLEFANHYLSVLPNYLKDYIEGKSINQSLYLVNEKIAVVSAFPEVFETIGKIFGSKERCMKLYINNEFPLNPSKFSFALKPKDKYSIYHNQIVNFINYFGNLGGFDSLINLMKVQIPLDKSSKYNKDETILAYKIPINILRSMICDVFSPILKLMSMGFKEKFFPEFKTLFFTRFDTFSNKELKDQEYSSFFELIREGPRIFEEHMGKEAYIFSEQSELNMCLVMLKCPFLEKKIKAIQELRDMIERFSTTGDPKVLNEKRKLRSINPEKFKNFLAQAEIFEYVFEKSFHPEIAKRFTPIVNFLLSSNYLSKEHLELIWNSSLNKHEVNTRIIYDILNELTPHLSVEFIDFLFEKISSLPQNSITESSIGLIKEFTANALNVVSSQSSIGIGFLNKKSKGANSKYPQFGTNMLWEIIQEESTLQPNLMKDAYDSFNSLLKMESLKNEREKYLGLCFDNITSHKSVPQSLLVILNILSTYSNGRFMKESLEDVIKRLNNQYSLIDLIVDDCKHFSREVNNLLKTTSAKQMILRNKLSVSQNIENRLYFIEIINSFLPQKSQITFNHLKSLWESFVLDLEQDLSISEPFLNWLTNKTKSSSKENYILNETLMKTFFVNVFGNGSYMKNYSIVSPNILTCIKKMWEVINVESDAILRASSSWKVMKYSKLFGNDIFWAILIHSSDADLAHFVRSMLILIHTKFSRNISNQEKMEICEKFFRNSIEMIHSNITDKVGVKNLLNLLEGYLQNLDGVVFRNEEEASNKMVKVYAFCKITNSTAYITLPANAILVYLRKEVTEKFKLSDVNFEMIYAPSNITITSEMEEEYAMKAFDNKSIKENEFDLIVKESALKVNERLYLINKFKNVISSDSKIIDIFLNLLSSNDEEIVGTVWKIMKMIPKSQSLSNQLLEFSFDSQLGWNSIFDSHCFRKLLYILEIVKIIIVKDNSNWVRQFCRKEGHIHLFKIYMENDLLQKNSKFQQKAFGLISDILGTIFNDAYPVAGLDQNVIQNYMAKCSLDLISLSKKNKINHNLLNGNLSFLNACQKSDKVLFAKFMNMIELPIIILQMICYEDEKVRQSTLKSLLKIYKSIDEKYTKAEFQTFFIRITESLLSYLAGDDILSNRDKKFEFFQAIEYSLKKLTLEDLESLSEKNAAYKWENLAKAIIAKIMKLTIYEDSTKIDFLSYGFFESLKRLIELNSIGLFELKEINDLLTFVVKEGLFEIPGVKEVADAIIPPLCKSDVTRKSAFRLLLTVIDTFRGQSKYKLSLNDSFKYISDLLTAAHWRSRSYIDWNISLESLSGQEKSDSGYVGLKNLGCTCYMNALFQQFYMLKEFREGILNGEISEKTNSSENIHYQFKLIMASLKYSQRKYYDPRAFCLAFKDPSGNPINVFEQMDAEEFLLNFLDKLESKLKGTSQENLIKNVFGGTFSNELICKGCPHYSEREEPFLAVSVEMKNKKSLDESLQAFIKGEMLEGENAYFCDKCDKKVDTLKRCSIKKLPKNLVIALKRFEFDFDYMAKIKVNDYCEFPNEINMKHYLQEYLSKLEKSDSNSMDIEDCGDKIYDLYGVVIHMGSAESGHYYSLIKGENEEWLEFNDTVVRPFDFADLASEAFGGEEKSSLLSGFKGLKEKSRNGYLLFYKERSINDESSMQKLIESVGNLDEHDPIHEVNLMNSRFCMARQIFDPEFAKFISSLLAHTNLKSANSSEEIEISKFGFFYFMTVVIRSQFRDKYLPIIFKNLKTVLSKNEKFAEWILNQFVLSQNILEFFIECPILDMKYIISGFIRTALQNLSNNEVEYKQTIYAFYQNLILTLTNLHEKKKAEILYKLFCFGISYSQEAVRFLIENKFISISAYHIYDQELSFDISYLQPSKSIVEKIELKPQRKESRDAKNVIKSIDELIEKKKEKNDLDKTKINYSNLIKAISMILRCLGERSNFQLKSIQDVNLCEDEQKIILNPEFWKKLVGEATTNTSIISVCKFFSHISYKQSDLSSSVIKFVNEEMAICDDFELKNYFKILSFQIMIEDEWKIQRIAQIMEMTLDWAKENIKTFRPIEIFFEFLFKCSYKSPIFLQYCEEFIKKKECVQLFDAWISTSKNLYSSIITNKMKLYRNRNSTVFNQLINQNIDKIHNRVKKTYTKLQALINQNREALQPALDSDEDFSEIKFTGGTKIDILYDNQVYAGTIIDTMEEMIQVNFEGVDKSQWVHHDNQKIGPYKAYQAYMEDAIEYIK